MYNLGAHKSPDGIIEYRGDAFCGQLKGNLLISNYSVGDDISRVELSSDGQTVTRLTSLAGNFADPLVMEQDSDGNIYVTEQGGNRVTVLKPQNPATCA
jgi:hypothetical protein